VTRWPGALIAIVVLVALGAFFWPTIHRTIVAPHVAEAPPPASAPVAQNSPPASPPAFGSQTSPSAPAAQSAPAAPVSAPVGRTSPSSAAPVPVAQTPAPAPVAQAPASAGASAGQATDGTPGSNDKAATELASLKPGFDAKDLVSALNDSKFNFALASAEVPAEMTDFLKRAADEMKRLPRGQLLEIAGYTDSSGNPAKNVALSRKRAEAVREALIKDGANPDMLVAKGYGSADPIASNDIPEGRLRNRRIEFHVVSTP
jgi:outer membrane protein OmpA-like peptidoglycan-associated protein